MEINNKVGIVTGGIRGIGLAITQHLLRKGAKYVAILDIHKPDSEVVENNLKLLQQEFNKDKFGYYVCDVTNHDQFIANYKQISEQQSYVDILVNNAGVLTQNNVDAIFDINAKAVIKDTLTAIEHMGKHKGGKGGVVVNMGSFCGLINVPAAPIYGATKHAVVAFVRSMKEYNEKLGVRILCICPGMTRTEMVEPSNMQYSLLDFVDPSDLTQYMTLYHQAPDNVATAVVDIIERGKPGDVWLVKDDEPAYNVKDVEDLEEMKIPF